MKLKRSGMISIIMVALIAAMLALPLPALGQPVTSLVKGDIILDGETLAAGPNVRITVEGSTTQGSGTADGCNYYEISLIGTAADAGKILNFELNIEGTGWVPANWTCVDCVGVPPAFVSWEQQDIDLSLGVIPPTVSFAAANVNVNEGATATVEVVLSEPGTQTITVQYDTQDNTAVAPGDYTARTGVLTFGVGDVSETFTVPTVNDAVFEGNEILNVVLSNPTNARLGAPNPATVTIIDDDVPEVYFANDMLDMEEGDSVTVGVMLSGPSPDTVTVDFTTVDTGDATAGVDYTTACGQLTFDPGQTYKTFQVDSIEDTYLEGGEAFDVMLSNPTNATLGALNRFDIPILDDDVATQEWWFNADHAPLIAPFPNNNRPFLAVDELPIDNIYYEGDWFQILKYDENDEVPGCDWLIYVSGFENPEACSLDTLVSGEYYFVVVSDASQPLQW